MPCVKVLFPGPFYLQYEEQLCANCKKCPSRQFYQKTAHCKKFKVWQCTSYAGIRPSCSGLAPNAWNFWISDQIVFSFFNFTKKLFLTCFLGRGGEKVPETLNQLRDLVSICQPILESKLNRRGNITLQTGVPLNRVDLENGHIFDVQPIAKRQMW